MPSPILAIPLYTVLSYYPHFAAQNVLIGSGNYKNYNNASPRSADTHAVYQKALTPEQYARWERCRAAHANGLEALPLFAATVLAGMYAQVPGMWTVAGANLALRLLYSVLYINTTSRSKSMWRSLIWALGLSLNLGTLVRASLM